MRIKVPRQGRSTRGGRDLEIRISGPKGAIRASDDVAAHPVYAHKAAAHGLRSWPSSQGGVTS